MQVVDNKAVLIRTRYPEKITSVIPKSKVVEAIPGGAVVAVFLGLEEMRVLRNLGFKAPSPIEHRYGWPGRFQPMAHQRTTAAFCTLNPRGFVFNEPGTGKTMSVAWAADYLMTRGLVRRVLVICPVSIMYSAWMADLQTAVVHRSAAVAHHSKPQRRVEIVKGDYEFIITNYEGVELIGHAVRSDGRFDLVIVDEANAYKNPQTRRWKALNSILQPTTMLWMMTGTPAAQSPVDAYGLARLVNPNGVPKFATAWRDKVMNKVTQFKWVPKADAKKQVLEALQPAIRFAKKDCMDLPPVVTVTREVALTAQQAKYYKLIKEQMLAQASGVTITAVNAGVMVSKLLQISCGAAYSEGGETVVFDAKPRLNELLEVVEETDRKVIVFAMFRSSMDAICEHLNKNGINTAQIHGDVTPSKRGEIIEDFQRLENVRVLVMQPQATAHGITLTAADNVVFFGPLMSVEQYLQCIARADRKGQTADKVTVTHIQSSPIEVKMFKALQGKVTDHSLLVDCFSDELGL